MDIAQALELIAERSPFLSGQALRASHSDDETRQRLYNRLVAHALIYPRTDWTLEERAALLALVTKPSRDTAPRDTWIQVRVSPAEKATLCALANAAGMTLSAFIRNRALS